MLSPLHLRYLGYKEVAMAEKAVEMFRARGWSAEVPMNFECPASVGFSGYEG